jgi:4-hydroxy-4-methyl-2-oxoglutarate aldolase
MALTIHDRPSNLIAADELAAWRTIPAAVIADELNRAQTMSGGLSPLSPGMGFAAQALTVDTMVGDNGPLHYSVTVAWPGCAIVVDASGHLDTAVWGGILTEAAKAAGVVAVIVDGAIRDAAELRESGIAVYARAIVPRGPHKGFGGTINAPIQCAGAAVAPGDLLVGDDDGIVVVRPDQMDGLMERCRARIAKEEDQIKAITAGKTTVELLGLPAPEDFS